MIWIQRREFITLLGGAAISMAARGAGAAGWALILGSRPN